MFGIWISCLAARKGKPPKLSGQRAVRPLLFFTGHVFPSDLSLSNATAQAHLNDSLQEITASLLRYRVEALQEACSKLLPYALSWVSGSKLSSCLSGFNRKLILILLELVRLLRLSACSAALGSISSGGSASAHLAGSPHALLRQPNSPRLLTTPPVRP